MISLNKEAKHWAGKILTYMGCSGRANTYSQIVNVGFDIEDTAKKHEKVYTSIYEKDDNNIIFT